MVQYSSLEPHTEVKQDLEGIVFHIPDNGLETDNESELSDTEVLYFMGDDDTFLGTATPPQGVTPEIPGREFIHLSPPNLDDLKESLEARFSPTDLVI